MRNTARISLIACLGALLCTPALAQGDNAFDAILAQQNQGIDFDAASLNNNASPFMGNANVDPALAAQLLGQVERQQGAQSKRPDSFVQVPLDLFSRIFGQVQALARKPKKRLGPAVVLGEASYRGRANADTGALQLQASILVTLGRPGQWKTVPLVGEDVVLARATVAGKPIPVSTDRGYHVWITDRVGELTVELELLIPARGPRGSIEYDFQVARTPVTSFESTFPMAGLEPRLDGAVRSNVESVGGETVLSAVVRPTTRIHLVGFRDLGASAASRAHVYVDTLNLLSVDENSLELFAALRYTILYAGTKEFLVHLPKGVKVISADGRGAFRYTLEDTAEGILLRGETAFPIRDSYEISLRLERDLPKDGEITFEVPLPRCQGVERQVGWLAVEVPGKTRLEEAQRAEMLAIDMRQLPPDLVRSAVSPILEAYRYHDASQRRLHLKATRLPEQETESDSVDRVRAFSVVSKGGDVLTEMRISLRNRLRHSIALDVSKGTRVRSVLLDGRPVKPSRDGSRLMLPLERSAGNASQLTPITLQVILEDRVDELDFLGTPELQLPAVDLQVSSLSWSIFVPASNLYSAPRGDIGSQSYYGRASWREPIATYSGNQGFDLTAANSDDAGLVPTTSAYTGAMPVRISIPKTGVRLEYQRYWLEAGEPAQVSFRYLSRWLSHPLIFSLGLMLMLGCWLLHREDWTRYVGGAFIVLPVWPLAVIASKAVLLGFAIAGLAVYALPRAWPPGTGARLGRWARTMPERYRVERHEAQAELQAQLTEHPELLAPTRKARRRRIFLRLLVAAGLVTSAFFLAEQLMALLDVLDQPMGG